MRRDEELSQKQRGDLAVSREGGRRREAARFVEVCLANGPRDAHNSERRVCARARFAAGSARDPRSMSPFGLAVRLRRGKREARVKTPSSSTSTLLDRLICRRDRYLSRQVPLNVNVLQKHCD
jgi:hypothetical protein